MTLPLPERPAEVVRRTGAAAALPVLACLAGFLLTTLSLSVILVFAIFVLLLAPLLARWVAGEFDLLEPLVWANAALGLMFVARPVAHLAYGDMQYPGPVAGRSPFDLTPTFDSALVAALVGIVALYLGYFAPFGRRLGRRLAALPRESDNQAMIAFALALFLLGILLALAFTFKTGQPLIRFGYTSGFHPDFAFRSSTAYLYYGPYLTIPATLLVLQAAMKRRDGILHGIALLMAVAFVAWLVPQGGRLWIMAILASLAIYPMLRHAWRPSLLFVAGFMVIAFFIGVTFLRDARIGDRKSSVSETLVESLRTPSHAWHDFILGADTEMFDALAVEMQQVPRTLPFKPGSVALSIVGRPIPRLLWPQKPADSEAILNASLYPELLAYTRAGPAYSFLGGFYFDSGFVGVALGAFAVGAALRLLFEYLRANASNAMVQLFYASALPFSVVLLRGNVPDTLSRMLFVVVPIIVIAHIGRSSERVGRSVPQAVSSMSTRHG